MRLLNCRSKELESSDSLPRPARYAIVSHRWGAESEEVLFSDIGDEIRAQNKRKGYDKINGACRQAVQDGLTYLWLDTCCIDRRNSAELGEAINSMYRWYQTSDVCYAYLHDVSDISQLTRSDWFSRGWTLQELIAPKKLKFFGKDWHFLGTREDLIDPISEISGIGSEVLRSSQIPQDMTISQKMRWAAKRQTSRVEDRAYSLLGILGIRLDPIYGIDDGAFEDLQHKLIMKYSDQTLFSWCHTCTRPDPPLDPIENDADTPQLNATGLLASSPSNYSKSYEIAEEDFRKLYIDKITESKRYRSHFSVSNNHVRILLPVKHVAGLIWKAVLRCSFEPPDGRETQRPLVIYLKKLDHWKYVRVHLVPEVQERMAQEDDGRVPTRSASVPGSLERLSDAELDLQGYSLQKIDVLARYAENHPSRVDDQSRHPSPGPVIVDRDLLPKTTTAEPKTAITPARDYVRCEPLTGLRVKSLVGVRAQPMVGVRAKPTVPVATGSVHAMTTKPLMEP